MEENKQVVVERAVVEDIVEKWLNQMKDTLLIQLVGFLEAEKDKVEHIPEPVKIEALEKVEEEPKNEVIEL